MNKKIKIAFIKFGGMAAGGTEKFFQIIAANLSKEKFDVTYFYCDAAPYIGSDWKHPDTDESRLVYMREHDVKCIKFNVAYKDVTKPTHNWIDTNLWEVFDEKQFDIVTSARSGHPEYPFIHIKQTPIVDTIHLPGMVDNQENIEAVIHLSEWNKNVWIRSGGNASKAHVIYLPIQIKDSLRGENLRKTLDLEGKFVFGMHQRMDDGIFSHVPLAAYEKIATENTAFLLLGGSTKYVQQAELLELKNFKRLEPTGDFKEICKFLETLDVYSHGRADGENNSQSIAEAMAFSKPIVSHLARANGHVETIDNAGRVVENVEQYAQEMKRLIDDNQYYSERSRNARNRFDTMYNLQTNIRKFEEIYESVYRKNQKFVSDDEWLSDWLED